MLSIWSRAKLLTINIDPFRLCYTGTSILSNSAMIILLILFLEWHYMQLKNWKTIVDRFACVTESKGYWLKLYIEFSASVYAAIRYGWRIVYLSNARIQAYCLVFDYQAKRTMSPMQPANWEAISNSQKTW